MITQSQLITSFIAGLLSFFAPCVIPLFPSYFSVITGFTFSQLYGLSFSKIRIRVFISSLWFIGGFTIVYAILGATSSLIGQVLSDYLPILLRVSGVLLVGFGLMQTGIIKTESLTFDFAWKIQKRLAHLGYLTAFITGVASALSWIPCIGPFLGSILLLAAQTTQVGEGVLLLFTFALGLTLPFLLGGLFFPFIARNLQEHRKALHFLSVISGIILILFGLVLILGYYQVFLTKYTQLIHTFIR